MSLDSPVERASHPLVVLADDLSGAAECAGTLPECHNIVLGPGPLSADAGDTLVVDLDTRWRSAAEAARVTADAVRSVPEEARLFKKADSLLRGQLAAETVEFIRRSAGLVVAPALPVAGRTVSGGVVRLHGVPLHHTAAWRQEPRLPSRAPPESGALGDRVAGSGADRARTRAPGPWYAPSPRPSSGALPPDAHLVLTGGDTARRVLDALRVTRLHPVGWGRPPSTPGRRCRRAGRCSRTRQRTERTSAPCAPVVSTWSSPLPVRDVEVELFTTPRT
ncbi:four-carbon acid sugar kinase family protein [Streptomyces pseudoechinosporeus]